MLSVSPRPATIQRAAEKTVTFEERMNKAVVGDRHNPPHPYMDLGGWYKTVMTERIADLFRTPGGLPGHVIAVQQELTRLSSLIDDKVFGTYTGDAVKMEEMIWKLIVKTALAANFDFGKQTFEFSGSKVHTIAKVNGATKLDGEK